jgi:hypothetical protein
MLRGRLSLTAVSVCYKGQRSVLQTSAGVATKVYRRCYKGKLDAWTPTSGQRSWWCYGRRRRRQPCCQQGGAAARCALAVSCMLLPGSSVRAVVLRRRGLPVRQARVADAAGEGCWCGRRKRWEPEENDAASSPPGRFFFFLLLLLGALTQMNGL